MTIEEQIIKNLKRCPRFENCSINSCPLDLQANLRRNLSGENRCPFTINKKCSLQKGIKTQIPVYLFELIPKSNLKMLSRRNLKLWQAYKR